MNPASTNTVLSPFRVERNSTATPAAGIGVAIDFAVETTAGNTEMGMRLAAEPTTLTATSEDFAFNLYLMSSGAAPTKALGVTDAGDVDVVNDIRWDTDTTTVISFADNFINLQPEGYSTLSAFHDGTTSQVQIDAKAASN